MTTSPPVPSESAPSVSVVLPAHNEVMLIGSTVTNLVTGLEDRGRSFELIVVENGSTDGTLRLARLIEAQLRSVRVVSLPRPDYGAALALGLRSARGTIIATFDVDYFDLAFFDRAIELIESEKTEIVLASKRAPGSIDRRSVLRRTLTAGFASLVERTLEMDVSDAHGMKVMRASSVLPLLDAISSRGSLFDVELIARATRSGVTISELPVVVRELRPPRSSVARRVVESGVGLARLRLVLGRPSHEEAGYTFPRQTRRGLIPRSTTRLEGLFRHQTTRWREPQAVVDRVKSLLHERRTSRRDSH